MLSSYSHLRNILKSAKNLLSNSVLYHIVDLKKLNNEGAGYDLYKCDHCGILFDDKSEESINIFACSHKYHTVCPNTNKTNSICIICKRNEIEDNITNPNSVSKTKL